MRSSDNWELSVMGGARLPNPPPIEAITKLNDLEKLADDFLRDRGYAPEMISHWDPKPEFGRRIDALVHRGDAAGSLVEYVYSGYLQLDPRIRSRLHEPGDRGLLLTPSGTTSINNVLAYLRNVGYRKLHVIAPSYFAVEACASTLGIETTFSTVSRTDGKYWLPNLTTGPGPSAVWITLPIYGTSCYVDADHVAERIDALPENVIAIVDEGLAFCDRPSLQAVKSIFRVLRLTTPHKPICVNGEKVSIITVPEHLSNDLDGWSECFAGGIGAAGARALSFVASNAYDQAVDTVRQMLAERLLRLNHVLSRHHVDLDASPDGHFVTIYWPKLSMTIADDPSEMNRIVHASGCLPIPSSRNRHPGDYGFAFRVNLLRLDDAGLGGLARLADVLGRL